MDGLVIFGLVTSGLYVLINIGLMVTYAAREKKKKENEHRVNIDEEDA